MITFTLKDSTNTTGVTYEWYDAPFTDSEINGENEITTLSGDVYVDYLFQKRSWAREFAFMSEDEYLTLKGFVDRQRTLYRFPTLTIKQGTSTIVSDVPVRMTINDRKTTNSCGTVEKVKITMRETVQP